MFRKNTRHRQIPLTGPVDELPELAGAAAEPGRRPPIGNSSAVWTKSPSAVLYADTPSRPNVSVNVLVSLEFLQVGNGRTDEEMYNRFRERLARHMQETGENLLEQAFEQVTDEQLQAFSFKTGRQRMDSTLPASHIRQMGRVQRLVTVLQRVWRMLSEEDPLRYADLFALYLKGHAGQYVYRLQKDDLPVHLQRIGEEMRRLLTEREAAYGDQPADPVLARVFTEHFRPEPEGLRVKEARELSAGSLQSPDDLEVTDRERRGQGRRGYGANLTGTCDPENPVQLMTKKSVQSVISDILEE